MKFTLSAGIWEYWMADKKTGKPLSCKQYIGELIKNTTEIEIIPKEHENNEDACIYIQRTR